MNHMNIFHNYNSLNISHENMLTRSFLILVNLIPLYRMSFFDLINKTMESNNDYIKVSTFDLNDTEVETQIEATTLKNRSDISDLNVLSILISNEKYNNIDKVEEDDYGHIYDGIVKTQNNLFIIENKPSVSNVWREQLNLNIDSKKGNKIVNEICSLKWSDIINFSNLLVKGELISPLERKLIEDFLNYIDSNYSWLNAYDRFDLCKNDEYLLNKRCANIMSKLYDGAEVLHHKGWYDYVNVNNDAIKQIALHSNNSDDSNYIELIMVAGDSMNRALKMFNYIDKDKALLLQKEGFKVENNFHFSFMNTNLVWPKSDIDILEYIDYWKKVVSKNQLYQVSRKDNKNEFIDYYNKLLKAGIVKKEDLSNFMDVIVNKEYKTINVCPSITFKYSWNKEEAIDLDIRGKFIDDFKVKVNYLLDMLK